MLKIKLARIGKTGAAHYRIVVAERRSKRDGRFTDQIGYYRPQTQPASISVNQKRLQYWLEKGAQPTATIRLLLKINGPTA